MAVDVTAALCQSRFRRLGGCSHINGRWDDLGSIKSPKGLSRQHLEELALSGFSFTRLFDKNRSPDFPGTIEVIDINKLGDGMGDKTVAVEAFEGNNLVLVDEGHRGAGSAGGAWMARREALVSNGFAFEYSATFESLGTEHELCSVFVGITEIEPTVNSNEISAWRWIGRQALTDELRASPDRYTPWLRLEWAALTSTYAAALPPSA